MTILGMTPLQIINAVVIVVGTIIAVILISRIGGEDEKNDKE